MSVTQSTDIDAFNIIYYIVLIYGGPALLMYLIFFFPIQKQLNDAYLQSGITIRALIAHAVITIHRNRLTCIETRRDYQISYVYKDPASDTLILKDYVYVQKHQLEQRLFTALILPGRPDSGVPDFFIVDLNECPCIRYTIWVISTLLSAYCCFVFAVLFADSMGHCHNDYRCEIGLVDIVLAVIASALFGVIIAAIIHYKAQKRVPGRVLQRIPVSSILRDDRPHQSQTQPQHAVRIDLSAIDDSQIPMAQAVVILENDYDNNSNGEHNNNNAETDADADADADAQDIHRSNYVVRPAAATLPPIATIVEAEAVAVGAPQISSEHNSHDGEDLEQFPPQAKAVELV